MSNKRPKYEKLSQTDHVLCRPDTYIGSIAQVTQPAWVIDPESNLATIKECQYSKGLLSLVNELLVNTRDVVMRSANENATIEVTVDQHEIVVLNKGKSHYVDVALCETHQVYYPELVFGNLLSGSNFDDTESKLTGGRNGLGAKCAFIFSEYVSIEVADPVNKRKFFQEMFDNMKRKSVATITNYAMKTGYVRIKIRPQLHRFNMTSLLETDFQHILRRRMYDLSACTTSAVKLVYNGVSLTVKDFKDYVALFVDPSRPRVIFSNERWTVCITQSDRDNFSHVSMVNGIDTVNGGTHVRYILDQITTFVVNQLKRKNKDNLNIKPGFVKDNLFVIVIADIVNPSFTSQTKEELATPKVDFGSTCLIPDEVMAKLMKKPFTFTNDIMAMAKYKSERREEASQGPQTNRKSVLSIPKLDDAAHAGTSRNSGGI